MTIPPEVAPPSEICIKVMTDSATPALEGAGRTAAIAAVQDKAAITTGFGLAAADTNQTIIGRKETTATLPDGHANICALPELTKQELESVRSMLAQWRTKRKEAGLPTTGQDLWASLSGETSAEEELVQRLALLLPRP